MKRKNEKTKYDFGEDERDFGLSELEEKMVEEFIKNIRAKKLKKPSPQKQKEIKTVAANTLKEIKKETKSARANFRFSPSEIAALKKKAETEGMPYQTLVTRLIRKYLRDRLLDLDEIEKVKQYFSAGALF